MRITSSNFAKNTLSLCFILNISIVSAAPITKIIYQPDSVEADKIEIVSQKNSSEGQVRVSGCKGCPLVLKLDEKTTYYYNNKPANIDKARLLSHKPGTVIFDADKQYTYEVHWW